MAKISTVAWMMVAVVVLLIVVVVLSVKEKQVVGLDGVPTGSIKTLTSKSE